MRFILMNDLHLTARSPASWKVSWEDAVFDKLAQVLEVCRVHPIKAVCIAGDLFHVPKIPVPLLVRFVRWCYELRALYVDVLTIPGNHDEEHERVESLGALPYGLLCEVGAIRDVSLMGAADADFPRYANQSGHSVEVMGIGYPQATSLDGWRGAPGLNAGVLRIVMAHCFAAKDGGSYFGQPIHRYIDLYERFPAHVYHFGHDHSDHGIVRLEGALFVNIGAVERGALANDQTSRKPKCALVTVDGSTVDVKTLVFRHAPAEEVFDLEAHEQRKAEQDRVGQFVTDLSEALKDTAGEALDARIARLDLPQRVRQRVLDYVGAAE